MQSRSQFGHTVFLEELQSASSAHTLKRIQFNKNSQGVTYDEAWLQRLIMLQPRLIPVSHIEPTFSDLVPICRELPMRAGFVDNVFVTPNGNIVLVECKLWRNPEARRKVIAQIIDYASELATWSYEKLDSAVKLAASLDRHETASSRGIFEMVSTAVGEIEEAAFHDAVSRNLRLGQFLLLIVGDGIQEGIQTMAEYLQKYAGLHFTLSLVEMALFELPSGGLIVQPRVLVRTENIVRAVVMLDDTRLMVAPETSTAQSPSIRKANITEDEFFRELERNSPGISVTLTSFLAELTDLNIQADYGSRTLTLRWTAEDLTWNLGTIVNSGEVWMDYHATQAWNRHVVDESKTYLARIASLVPGASVKPTKLMNAWNVANSKGHALRIGELLADNARREGWRNAIQHFELDIAKQIED